MVTITVFDAELRVWHENQTQTSGPSAERDPDRVIGTDHLDAVSISSRAGNVRDEVQIDIERGPHDLRVGDRVHFVATIATTSRAEYGSVYGRRYGGNLREVDWVGRVEPTNKKTERVQHGAISVDATDWPAGILSDRTVTGAWEDADVGAIIREIVQDVASEVDASGVPDLGVSTDQFFQNRNAWDAVVGLAAKGDTILSADGDALRVDPIPDLTPAFELATDDYALPWDVTTEDKIKNVVRVDSGVSRQQEEAQETVNTFDRVTDADRRVQRVGARKSQIHSVELYVQRDPDSDDDLKVRVQADDGSGAPVAPSNQDSDITSASWAAKNLPSDGWKTFFLPDHTLPPRGDPWIIVEASGPDGHDVGADGAGALAYVSYYPHPLNFEVVSGESIREYGPREIAIEKKNLETITATRDAARAELARRAWPEKNVSFDAQSPRCHALEPGDVVTNTDDRIAETGDYIIMERSMAFDPDTVALETSLTATWRKGVLAPNP